MGTISANGDREIGELIARAMERVGKEGVITVQVNPLSRTELIASQSLKGIDSDEDPRLWRLSTAAAAGNLADIKV